MPPPTAALSCPIFSHSFCSYIFARRPAAAHHPKRQRVWCGRCGRCSPLEIATETPFFSFTFDFFRAFTFSFCDFYFQRSSYWRLLNPILTQFSLLFLFFSKLATALQPRSLSLSLSLFPPLFWFSHLFFPYRHRLNQTSQSNILLYKNNIKHIYKSQSIKSERVCRISAEPATLHSLPTNQQRRKASETAPD